MNLYDLLSAKYQRRAASSASPGPSNASVTAQAQRPEGMMTLMGEIRTLGHIPRWAQGLGAEHVLYRRLRYAKANSLLKSLYFK